VLASIGRLSITFNHCPYEQVANYRQDDPYTLEQLQGPRINVSLVRPLVDRLYDDGKDISISE